MNLSKSLALAVASLKALPPCPPGRKNAAPQSPGRMADGIGVRCTQATQPPLVRSTLVRWLAILVLSLWVISPKAIQAEIDGGGLDDCDKEWISCQLGCLWAGPAWPECSLACDTVWGACKILNNFFSCAFVTAENVQASEAFVAGGYILATNSLGTVGSVTVAVAPWNGTNFLTASTITNVTFYAIPKNQLAAYSATNYEQAPWVNVGTGTNNNGYWTVAWTPPAYTNYMLAAIIGDAVNGTVSTVAWARPQLPLPEVSSLQATARGKVTMWVHGPVHHTYSIQSSPDLHLWNNFVTVSNFTGQGQIEDVEITNVPQKYYRALMQ